MIDLFSIQRALRGHQPERLEDPDRVSARASVAMVFAGPPERLELCFIKRAERPGDRWSGHMAFPGGRADPGDPTHRHVAAREAREEVGLALEPTHHHVGDLSELNLYPHGNPNGGVLSPVLFYIGEQTPALVPEPAEVARASWIALEHLYDPDNLGYLDWETPAGDQLTFPGVRHRGELIWGLTWRVLHDFSELVGLELPGQMPDLS